MIIDYIDYTRLSHQSYTIVPCDDSLSPSTSPSLARSQLRCCGVTDEGWGVFRDSKWFEEQGAIDDVLGYRRGSGNHHQHACVSVVV